MLRHRLLCLISLSAALLVAGPPWKDKPVAEWSDEDTKQVLSDSPWAKTVQPAVNRSGNDQRQHGGMGRGGGIGIGGIGIGLPGGMGRRGGRGYPGGGGPAGPGAGPTEQTPPPTLTLRWESALPVREAELKARETNAPDVDEKFYAVAVYGVPDRMLDGTPESLAAQFKKTATLKREGKKAWKPARVEVLRREDGPVIVYLFPRSNEITRQDKRVGFDAKVLRLQFIEYFHVDDMTYQGKLEL